MAGFLKHRRTAAQEKFMSKFAFEYFGVEISVEWDDPDLDAQLQQLLLPIWRSRPDLSPSRVFRISNNRCLGPEDEVYRGDRPTLYETVERRLHFYLANHCREVVFVHCGVLAIQERAVLIPARSYGGKTTLVQALLAAGAGFLSDEYAVIDRTGLVHPFPRPLSLRTAEGTERYLPAPERVQLSPLPLGGIFACTYEEGASQSMRPMTRAEGVLELLTHTVTARTHPELTMQCLSAAVRECRGLRGIRGEAQSAATEILAWMRSQA